MSSLFGKLVNDIITKGHIESDYEVSKDFKVRIKPIDTAELIAAENIPANADIPVDVYHKMRMVRKLSYAITAINDVPVKEAVSEGKDIADKMVPSIVVSHLNKLPGHIIDGMYAKYLECEIESKKLIMGEPTIPNAEGDKVTLDEAIEDFSEPHSDK